MNLEDSFEMKIKNTIQNTNNKTTIEAVPHKNKISNLSSQKIKNTSMSIGKIKKTENLPLKNNTVKSIPKSKSIVKIGNGQNQKNVSFSKQPSKLNSDIRDNNINKNSKKLIDRSSDKNDDDILELKKEITRLNIENQKLKEELNKEREQNLKIKSFAEELVKLQSG